MSFIDIQKAHAVALAISPKESKPAWADKASRKRRASHT
jgi:hypothetical protein